MNKKLNRNIILMGLTSFFTDVSSEMIYPLLQEFIKSVLAGQKALVGPVLGIVEGIAESTASLSKVFFGYYSDKVKNRKYFAITGYSLSSVSKLLLFLASSGWVFVLLSRFSDRIGKGIRTSPRDALISESVDRNNLGKAFGFHRAMDFAGAFIGVLICYFLTAHYLDPVTSTLTDLNSFYLIFGISVLPAFAGVVFLFFVKEKRRVESEAKPAPDFRLKNYNIRLKRFFLVQFIFTLGNSSNQFLFVRSMDLGFSLSSIILMYLFFNLTTSSLSTIFGAVSDKKGRKPLLIYGYSIYAVVYLLFGLINIELNSVLWMLWIVYGVYYAMTEGVEKALVSELSGKDSKATSLGFFHTITGVTLLPASLIAGILYSIDPAYPFIFGGITTAAAIILFMLPLSFKKTK